MSLQALPDELLLRILFYLQPSYADAAALSQCRRLYSLCDMSNRRKYRRIRLRDASDLTSAFKMLCDIRKTPRLGDYVQYLELPTNSDRYIFGSLSPNKIPLPRRSDNPEQLGQTMDSFENLLSSQTQGIPRSLPRFDVITTEYVEVFVHFLLILLDSMEIRLTQTVILILEGSSVLKHSPSSLFPSLPH